MEKPRIVLHGFPDRYPVERAEPLREDPDPGDDVALSLRNVHPENAHFSRCGSADRVGNLHGGGLAGAVRAKERENLALPDVERYVVDRRQVPVKLRQVLDFDCMLYLCRHGSIFCLYGSMYQKSPASPRQCCQFKRVMESHIFT